MELFSVALFQLINQLKFNPVNPNVVHESHIVY